MQAQAIRITLKAARVNANLTQQQAAAALGITPKTLLGYEMGKTSPNMRIVQKMESLYGIPAENFIFAQ